MAIVQKETADLFDITTGRRVGAIDLLGREQLEPGTGWRDMVASVAAAPVGVAAPTLRNFGAAGSLQRQEKEFAIGDYVFIDAFHVDHDVKPGGRGYLHVHWSTNGTNANTVRWELNVSRALGHNQAAFGAPAALYVTQAASGTAWKHMIAEVSDADALILTEPDELILVTLRRVTNGGTDNTDWVFGLKVDIHYETDRYHTPRKAPDFYAY